MPTYEYACEACGRAWEKEQRITEDPIKKCPHCGKMKARRMISSGNFILKGGGWYADLYSKPAANGKPAKTDDAAAAGDDKGAATRETKDTGTKDAAPGKKDPGSKTKKAAKAAKD